MKFSIIVPVYNDPNGIKDTLESLTVQDFPRNEFEIIVSDNGSTDTTLKIISHFIKNNPSLVRVVIEKDINSSYAARNKGISASRGDILVFIDADMTVNRNWLTQIAKEMDHNNADYMGCNVELFTHKPTLSGTYNILTGFKVEKDINNLHFSPTCCLVARRDVFKNIGMFNEQLISGGDMEFGNRAHQYGYKLHFARDIIMKHPARASLKALLRKSFRIGRGVAQLARYYPTRYDAMKRNVFSPAALLPATPASFQKIFRDDVWKKHSLNAKTSFYLIKWFTKIAKHGGYVYETLFYRLHPNS